MGVNETCKKEKLITLNESYSANQLNVEQLEWLVCFGFFVCITRTGLVIRIHSNPKWDLDWFNNCIRIAHQLCCPQEKLPKCTYLDILPCLSCTCIFFVSLQFYNTDSTLLSFLLHALISQCLHKHSVICFVCNKIKYNMNRHRLLALKWGKLVRMILYLASS